MPVFVADIKGDLTGLAAAGDATNAKVQERVASLGWTFQAAGHPVEFLSLTGKLGAQVRATVHSFGPLLLGKVLDLNETQTSILALVFKYCDDNDLPLLDLKDLATTLKYLVVRRRQGDPRGLRWHVAGVGRRAACAASSSSSRRAPTSSSASRSSTSTTCSGRPRTAQGIVSVLELSDVMDQPRLFSTFMLWMLAQLYEGLPEVGDLPKPKLCFFFDEAHLLFDDASDALMDQIERTARLIRSKGVGVYFVTQVPSDVPSSVLAQLGNRVQHALRAFTPEDADALRKAARTFPTTEFYDVEKTLTSLGTGEALVTVLSPRGDTDATRRDPAPAARLVDGADRPGDVPGPGRRAVRCNAKYGTTVDRDSAYERITARLAAARQAAVEAATRAGLDPTTAGGLNRMTPAQQQREIARQQREIEAADKRAAREEERQRRAAEKLPPLTRGRVSGRSIRRSGPAARSSSSRLGQDIIRGVFGTLFGGGRKR